MAETPGSPRPSQRLLRMAKWLLYLNVLVWLVLGIVSIVRILERHPDQVVTAWVIAALMFGNAAAMGLAGWAVARGGIWTAFALAVLAVNILLTFTDQVGALDWATLALDLAILGCWAASGWLARKSR